MSVITDIILLSDSLFEDGDLESLNRWLRERGHGELKIGDTVHNSGGRSAMQAFVATAAINGLDEGAFLVHCMRGIPWVTATRAHTVQLVMKGEHDDGFGLVTLFQRYDDDTFDRRYARLAIGLSGLLRNVLRVVGHAEGCSWTRGSGACECGLLAFHEEAFQWYGIDLEDEG